MKQGYKNTEAADGKSLYRVDWFLEKYLSLEGVTEYGNHPNGKVDEILRQGKGDR